MPVSWRFGSQYLDLRTRRQQPEDLLDVDSHGTVLKAGIAADPAVLAKDAGLLALIQQGIDAGNAKLSRVEQVKKFEVLPVFWAPGGDELTPTLKLRRKPINDKYSEQIEALYA